MLSAVLMRICRFCRGRRSAVSLRGAGLLVVLATATALWTLSGCLIVQVGVTNPLRGVNTVAVLPFFNQSAERSVDGRQLALLYASELQKIPGVEVIPVGVAEAAMRQYGLENLSGPQDVAKLALLLNADAVVVGTVTDYSVYKPPRLGLSIAWYSPYSVQTSYPVPVDSLDQRRIHKDLRQRRRAEFAARKRHIIKTIEQSVDRFFLFEPAPPSEVISGKNGTPISPGPVLPEIPPHPDPPGGKTPPPQPASQQPADLLPPLPKHNTAPGVSPPGVSPRKVSPPGTIGPPEKGALPPPAPPAEPASYPSPPSRFQPPIILRGQSPSKGSSAEPRRIFPARQQAPAPQAQSPQRQSPASASAGNTLRPLMTYTKVFDAGDSAVAAAFRDYLELRGDSRGGNWTARLEWADEFPRFVMHRMIVEMFQLHGGEARRRVIFKWRKHK